MLLCKLIYIFTFCEPAWLNSVIFKLIWKSGFWYFLGLSTVFWVLTINFFKRRLTLRNEVRKCMNKSTVITKICWTVLDFFTRYVQNTGCIEKTWTSLLSNLLVRMFRFSLRTVYIYNLREVLELKSSLGEVLSENSKIPFYTQYFHSIR